MGMREHILMQAKRIVEGSRDEDYGTPERNFGRIANLWTNYTGRVFTETDVAVMMILLKVSRIKESPDREDHWIDIAGYAACGAEVSILPELDGCAD
jgi:hypothetical protein